MTEPSDKGTADAFPSSSHAPTLNEAFANLTQEKWLPYEDGNYLA